ncbi:hypothetical protein VLL09_04720 [Dehalococcoides mccartyi]|uniref:Uncharacterized protein n=1 Tax=Dehalococcoides mccartyi TaxID=61435 RepID=A0AB38Z823_9CHLR|nr:hypothetical protein [Dehalococcoides mccartyi]WRO06696.1 hypothetical protein VLL09_04720 [Dehalococcoides mccartyi]
MVENLVLSDTEFADFKRLCKEKDFDLSYFSGEISGSKEEIRTYRFDSPKVIKLKKLCFGFQGIPYDVAEFQQEKWSTSLPEIREEFFKRRIKCQ